jgi:signal peptidase I
MIRSHFRQTTQRLMFSRLTFAKIRQSGESFAQLQWMRPLKDHNRSSSFSTVPELPSTLGQIFHWSVLIGWRIVTVYISVHLISDHGFQFIVCEGPSMYPTIRPQGEIILVDRWLFRRFGIQDGCIGTQRAHAARRRQEELYENNSNDSKDMISWHEPRIPVNQLPKSGLWSRFMKQHFSGLAVGDVVVVENPNRIGTVCKRILGLPGDMVVNPPPTSRLRHKQRDGLVIIPDGHVWIEGDNTMHSTDSRDYGPIPATLIVGRVICRIWPLRGSAMMQRGAPPKFNVQVPFSGSTILPAGYEGEDIIKTYATQSKVKKQKNLRRG